MISNVFGLVVSLGAVIVVWVILRSFFTVDTAEAAIVQRFGKFSRVAQAGLNFRTPIAERVV